MLGSNTRHLNDSFVRNSPYFHASGFWAAAGSSSIGGLSRGGQSIYVENFRFLVTFHEPIARILRTSETH